MNILTLLQEILGPYKKFSGGENYFKCPFCHNPKNKFAFNDNNLKWHCWHCGNRGGHIIYLLKLLNLPKKTIQQFKEALGEVDYSKYKKPEEKEIILYLPQEYKPLWKKEDSYEYRNALAYVKSRGMRVDDVLRYRIGFCDSGDYAGRIVIPSYDSDNNLNYFTARSYYNSSLKYKNPPVTKNIVCFENLISWEEPVILCEGMFDAIALRSNAIPLLGKNLPKKLERALVVNKVKDVIIFLDSDAKTEAMKMEHHLKQYNINTKLVLLEDKDASEMGFDLSWGQIDNAKSTNWKNLIEQRLSVI